MYKKTWCTCKRVVLLSKLIAFCRCRCRCRRRCWSSVLLWAKKFCYHGSVTSHLSFVISFIKLAEPTTSKKAVNTALFYFWSMSYLKIVQLWNGTGYQEIDWLNKYFSTNFLLLKSLTNGGAVPLPQYGWYSFVLHHNRVILNTLYLFFSLFVSICWWTYMLANIGVKMMLFLIVWVLLVESN